MNLHLSGRRRSSSILLLLLAAIVLLAGCSSKADKAAEGKVAITTTIYPLADFAVKIGGDHVHVTHVIPAGVEPHDWAPKLKDINRMADSQLLFYQGSGLEGWVDDFLKSLPSDSKLKSIAVSEGLAVHLEEGEPAVDAEDPDHEGEEAHDHDHDEEGLDPHTWLSPVLAKKMAERIKNELVSVDPTNKTDYETNFQTLSAKFDELDAKFRTELDPLPHKDIVVQHAAFGYLSKEYGLTQRAIMGLSPEAEPTARQLKSIKDFVKENDVKVIFFEELVSDKLAKTLAQETGAKAQVLSPLEGLTPEQEKAGEDYFSIMTRNLEHLVEALK
ncbi:zinc ABC transporter substrate-binding protein [Gorillibacterium sp. CAU 1737]|uniref:metal ABC transporter solute-binding protein, Zn/Mn family n=1 Tax=Gorillibacterium sp. CAU 1737 TaxID=3140362 RepID=UPI003261D2C9